jgi:hypothetical protein
MQQTAKILKFKGETLKTLKDVQAVELAVLEGLRSGTVTAMEAREIHIQIAAMLMQFADEVIKAKGEPTFNTPLTVRGIRLKLPM